MCTFELEKNNMRKIFILLILCVIAFVSCSEVKRIWTTYDYLRPAYYTLPGNPDSILLVNCLTEVNASGTISVADAELFLHYVNNIASEANDTAATSAADSLQLSASRKDSLQQNNNNKAISEELLMTKIFRSIPQSLCFGTAQKVNDSKYISMKVSRRRMPLDTVIVKSDSICRANGAKAIIALTNVGVSYKCEDQQAYVSLQTLINSQFALITRDGSIDYFEEDNDSLSMQIERHVFFDHGDRPAILDFNEYSFADKLYPIWDSTSRRILYTSTQCLHDAAVWVSKDEWTEARNLWVMAYNKCKDIEKFCAAYNLGVYNECLDSAYQASRWYSDALDILQNCKGGSFYEEEKELAEKGFEQAVARMRELERLDEQMY